jgi:hypothetical protein
MSTINVALDGREAGTTGSKQRLIKYQPQGDLVMMLVKSNLPNNLDRNAVIENLIIDGSNTPNTIGVLLENVCNGLIRNITIKDCDIGIKVKITGNGKAFGNRFEHVRMINVKHGIIFEGAENAKDFSYTTIDDVGISLAIDQTPSSDKTAIGIKVDSKANLYNAFIKATVWMSHYAHKCLVVDGEIKYSLVNIEVEQPIPEPQYQNDPNDGYGYSVFIGQGAVVKSNQSFLLTVLSPEGKILKVNMNGNTDDITVFP